MAFQTRLPGWQAKLLCSQPRRVDETQKEYIALRAKVDVDKGGTYADSQYKMQQILMEF